MPEEQRIKEVRDCLSHRGPDDAGLYYNSEDGVALGHRRLSIIDLSVAGRQPMASNDNRYHVVFNGEIYNYIEIKKELEGDYDFKTKTDTEVLLAAYIKWGIKCLHNFNGMFAFAVWDKVEKRLFCARDRLGIKPFYYHFDSGNLAFASEIKALLRLGVEPFANEPILFDYLYYGIYDHSEETFFKNIKSLPAGHYLLWQANKIKLEKYWDLADLKAEACDSLSEKEAAERLGNLLADSIKLRFRSDVPVGLNLSSGLDSNSLYHYALQITGGKIDTFSMCLSSEDYNECDLIDKMLNNKQKQYWHTCFLEPLVVLGEAEEMNFIQDQPYGGIPTIAYQSLINTVKQSEVIVLLEGQGVDEILAGYPYYKIENEKDNWQIKEGVSTLAMGQDMSKLIFQEILADKFIANYKDRPFEFPAPFLSHLLNAQYRDIRYTKLPRVLRFNDHVTMHYGRELRLPFLDYRIVEFCFFLPVKFKINGGAQKYLLRRLMAGIIPKDTQKRQKKVFGAIQAEWFRKYFKEQVYALLSSPSFQGRPYWNQKKLKEEVDKFYKGEKENSFFIWQCFNLEMWFNKFIDK